MTKPVKEAREKAPESIKARTTPSATAAKTTKATRNAKAAKTPKGVRPSGTGKTSPAVIEVGAAIIQRQGRYLVSQRPEGSHLGQCWEFPGGKRETGETIEECVVREIREELGIEVRVGKLWRVIQRAFPDRVVKLHFFMCTIESGTPRAIGCQHFRWILPSEFPNYDFPPADLDIIQDLARKALRLQAANA